jgi:hypothetical protein
MRVAPRPQLSLDHTTGLEDVPDDFLAMAEREARNVPIKT